MNKKLVHLVAGARPNFMKVAPLYHTLRASSLFKPQLVLTGQHYDQNLSSAILDDLNLPQPDFSIRCGSGTHAEQTARVLTGYESICMQSNPDLVVVVGDINSTLAACLAAKKLKLAVAHLEAGLRSFDRQMPEELNRILTDAISDILWTPSKDADQNLIKEGIDPKNIRMVGNIMIDSLHLISAKIDSAPTLNKLNLSKKNYGVVTLHRPTNVDYPDKLLQLINTLSQVSKQTPLIFPVHPRTQASLNKFGLYEKFHSSTFRFTPPLPYIQFMSLLNQAKFAITDSGGIQEETTYMNVPCFTLRENTERPITLTEGTNQLVSCESLKEKIQEVACTPRPCIQYWDGKTGQRILAHLKELYT